MPVIKVNKAEKLEPDHVYVMPPDRRVQLIDHEISPTEFEEPRGKRARLTVFCARLPNTQVAALQSS